MSSKTRVERLEHWLVQALQIPMENFSVSVEEGETTAEFTDEPVFGPLSDPAITEAGNEVAIEWSFDRIGTDEKASMSDQYNLHVVIRNYEKDIIPIKIGLLRWLHDENQVAKLVHDAEKNNHQTYDYFFDLTIKEKTFNRDGKLCTC